MDPDTRTLIKVNLPKRDNFQADERLEVDQLVTILMGKKPELRFNFIKENAKIIQEIDY